LHKYGNQVKKDSLLIVDSTFVDPPAGSFGAPFTRLAREEIGKEQVANIIALGFINKLASLVKDNTLEKAVLRRVPRGSEEVNLKALQCGNHYAAKTSKAVNIL